MPERRLSRMCEGVSALVRQCSRLCRDTKEALVCSKRCLARASICGRQARCKYDV